MAGPQAISEQHYVYHIASKKRKGNNPGSTILAVIAVDRLDTELQNANLEINHVIVVAGKATWSKCVHTQERYSKVHSDYKTRDIYNQFTR